MIRLAIVEDEASEREALYAHAALFFREQGEEAQILSFPDAQSFLKSEYRSFQILLLDIQMEGMDGLELAKRLRAENAEAIIIFVTNLRDCAVAGYAVEALGFIPKPAFYADIRLELTKALRRLSQREGCTLEIALADGLHLVRTASIYYLETEGHRVVLHTEQGKISYLKSMAAMEERLSGWNFFRCHTSYLVNLAHVERLSENDVQVHGSLLPVSRHRRKAFLKALTQYLRRHCI